MMDCLLCCFVWDAYIRLLFVGWWVDGGGDFDYCVGMGGKAV